MTDSEWYELVKAGKDDGWRRIWNEVIVSESRNARNAEMMRRYSLTDGDLMGMLFNDMIGRNKLELYRGEGSFQGWLRSYVRGYILNANPNKHGEIPLDAFPADNGDGRETLDVPINDQRALVEEAWRLTHYCLRELWNKEPLRAYIHVLKTRFHLSSEAIREMLEISSAANVDQIFSRGVKFMREKWRCHDCIGRDRSIPR